MPRPLKNIIPFTDRSVAALRASPTRVDYMCSDAKLRGFGLRVYPSGVKTWFVRYTKDGALRRFNLGTYPGVTLKAARTRAETTIGRLARGEDPQAERSEQRSAATFGDLAASYLELHAKQKKRTWKEDLRILNHDLLPAWRRLPAASIGRREIATLLDRIVERGAPTMANRTRALISKLFAWGKTRGHVDSNPAADTEKPGDEGSRDRVLSVPEIRTLWTLWETENSVTSAALRMLLLTGVRLTEALKMRWVDISGDWWTIPPHITKNKLGHRIYLSSPTLALLDELRLPSDSRLFSSPWVFPSPRSRTHIVSLNNAVKRFRALAAGHPDLPNVAPNWRVNDLRRTAATSMGDLGIPTWVIGLVLNHAADGGHSAAKARGVAALVTARYDRSRREMEIKTALQAWGGRLEEILRGEDLPSNVRRFRP
jgi:integrase